MWVICTVELTFIWQKFCFGEKKECLSEEGFADVWDRLYVTVEKCNPNQLKNRT